MQPIFRDLHIHTYSDAERSVQGYDVAILIRRPNRGSKPRWVIWQGQSRKLSEWERLSQSVYCRSNENPRICKPFHSGSLPGTTGIGGKRQRLGRVRFLFGYGVSGYGKVSGRYSEAGFGIENTQKHRKGHYRNNSRESGCHP